MSNYEDEFEELDSESGISSDINSELGEMPDENVVPQQNMINRQKVSNILDGAGNNAVKKIGVPEPTAKAAIKANNGPLPPNNMQLASNMARNQLTKGTSNAKDSQKLQNALGKHQSTPSMPMNPNSSGISGQSKSSFGQTGDKASGLGLLGAGGSGGVKDKAINAAVSKGITAVTRGAVKGKAAEAAAKIATQFLSKYKQKIIIGVIAACVPIFVILMIIMGETTNEDFTQDTVDYVTSAMSETDFIDELKIYGYCKTDEECKKTGSYQAYQKLKSIYEEYKKPCSGTLKNDQPCGITINSALILETITYYNNAEDSFQMDQVDIEELESITESDKNIILKSFLTLAYYIESAIDKQKELDYFFEQIENLALAQSEYVKEECGGSTQYFYQVSFDKYISYLKYGTSSSHPNYKDNTFRVVTNTTCQGPQNDYIENFSSSSSSSSGTSASGSGLGVEIANYALQFVGHPYVWGSKKLCTNWTNDTSCGVDCSSFTQAVMANFGISIPRTSSEQIDVGENIGTDIANAQAGDIICYSGHVAIYIGDGRIVHASTEKTGVKINEDATYREIVAIVRVWE